MTAYVEEAELTGWISLRKYPSHTRRDVIAAAIYVFTQPDSEQTFCDTDIKRGDFSYLGISFPVDSKTEDFFLYGSKFLAGGFFFPMAYNG